VYVTSCEKIVLIKLQYGIEYGYVGGDPAELMRICVENGVFTVSFLKEGVQKVPRIVAIPSVELHILLVPRMGRRFAQNCLGSLPRYRRTSRKSQCHGWLSHRRGLGNTLLQSVYYDMDSYKVWKEGITEATYSPSYLLELTRMRSQYRNTRYATLLSLQYIRNS